MLYPPFVVRSGFSVGSLAALVACGSVSSPAMPDAGPDAWAASCVPPALITTIESSDAGYGNACVHGQWLLEAFNGETTPPAPGRPGNLVAVQPTTITIGSNPLDPTSTFAIRVSGSGQENMGDMFSYAQLTAPLNAPSATESGTVDASGFTGVQFYARGQTGPLGLRLTVGTLFTDPIGGMCDPAPGKATSCFDNPGAGLTLAADWTRIQVPFASLEQQGFGNPSPVGAQFPKAAITHLKWDIAVPETGPTEPWELWIDDLTFY